MELLPYLANLAKFSHYRTARLTIHRCSHGLPISICACLIINVYIGSMLPYWFSVSLCSLSSQTIRSLIYLFIPPRYSGRTPPGHGPDPRSVNGKNTNQVNCQINALPGERAHTLSLSLSLFCFLNKAETETLSGQFVTVSVST